MIAGLITMWQLSLVILQINLNPDCKDSIKKMVANSMIESCSVCCIITKILANRILKSTPSERWITTKQYKVLKTFSNEPIKVLGKISTTVIYNDWSCEDACLTVVEDEHKLFIGSDLFISLGLAVMQQQIERGKCVNNIDKSTC